MGSPRTAPGLGLATIRLVLGLLVTQAAWNWITGDGLDGRELSDRIRAGFDVVSDLGDWWGREVLLYNPDGTAFLLRWSLLGTGVALILGAFTRPAATWLAFVAVQAYWFELGPDPRATLLLTVTALACAASRAGRRLGLDQALDGNLPTWMTWVRTRNDFLS